jgi:replicative DNA helicase
MTENLNQIIEIDSKYFQFKLYKEIHQKIALLERKGLELNLGNLITELNRDRTEAEDVSPAINQLIDLACEAGHVFDHKALTKELEEAFLRNECLDLALKIQKIAHDKTLNTTDIMNTIMENVDTFKIGTPLDDQYPLRYLAEGIAIKMDLLEKGVKSVVTGLKELDDITNGLAPKELIVLGGRPGDGKTHTSLVFAEKIASEGKSVVFFSAEMPLGDLSVRYTRREYFLQYAELLPSSRFDNLTEFTELERERITAIYLNRRKFPIIVQDKPGCILTLGDIKRDLLKAKNDHGQVGLVVIDYLQLITKANEGQLLTYAIGELLNGLKLLAYEFNCPFLLLSQLNTRSVGNRSEKRPYLSELSDSAQLEKYANKILLLYREFKYNPEADPDDLEIIVAKNRSGKEGTVKCSFNMETGILKGVN